MAYTFQFRDVFAQRDAIVDGLVLTLELSAGVIALGFAIGVMVAAVLVYGKPWARRIAAGYVEVIRNTPLLVQLFLIFFGLLNSRLALFNRHLELFSRTCVGCVLVAQVVTAAE